MFSPAVLTSRKADDHFAKIQAEHLTMLQGMQMQSMKVAALNQNNEANKASEKQNQATMKNEMQKSQDSANTDALKLALDFAQKQAELDVKRSALSAV